MLLKVLFSKLMGKAAIKGRNGNKRAKIYIFLFTLSNRNFRYTFVSLYVMMLSENMIILPKRNLVLK